MSNTIVYVPSGNFLTAGNNLSELSNTTTALSNLGFSSGTFLQVANNLSDVNNAITAQSNLSVSYTTLATGIFLPTGGYQITGINTLCANSGHNLILEGGTGASTNIVLQPNNTGWITTTGRLALTNGLLTLPTNSLPDTLISGTMRYNAITNNVVGFNSQREVGLGDVGWGPTIFPVGCSASQTVASALSVLPSGLLSVPFLIPSNILLGGITLRNVAVVGGGTKASMIWKLYQQPLNNGNSAEATLYEISGCSGGFNFSAQAAGNQSSTASGASNTNAAYVGPGCYWLTLLNNFTGNISIGTVAANTLAANICQTGSATGTLGPNMTFTGQVAPYIAWGKISSLCGIVMNCTVFGQTSTY